MHRHSTILEDYRPPAKLRLAALWSSLMFCYAYGDYFGMYVPGKLVEMGAGELGGFGRIGPAGLAAVAMMMAVPALMVTLSLMLPTTVSRWLNILFGIVYGVIMLLTMIGGAPLFYLLFGIIEIAVTLAIVLVAACWPRVPSADAEFRAG